MTRPWRSWFPTLTVVLAFTVSAIGLAGCGQVRAHKIKAFVRAQGTISVVGVPVPAGEALIKVKNDSPDRARIVLARTRVPGDQLPVRDGRVPVGGTADLTYDGAGYRVVQKVDDLAPFFARGQTSTVLHVHLQAGTYVLFSNLPGDYERGRLAEFVVTAPK